MCKSRIIDDDDTSWFTSPSNSRKIRFACRAMAIDVDGQAVLRQVHALIGPLHLGSNANQLADRGCGVQSVGGEAGFAFLSDEVNR